MSTGKADNVSHPIDLSPRVLGDAVALQRLIESNLLAVNKADGSGRVYEVNQATVELLGYSKEEWESGRVRWTEITPAEYADADAQVLEAVRREGKFGPFAKELIHKSGTRVPVMVGVCRAEESTELVYCFLIDLSALNNTRARLESEEARFRVLAENIPQIVWIADPDGRVTYFNRLFYELTGIDPEDEDGFSWQKVIHPDDIKLINAASVECSKGKVFDEEIRYKTESGEYRWFLARGIPIIGEDGCVREFFGTSTDIDAKKRMEDEIKESEIRLRMLADAIPQIVWTSDPEGRITFFNHRWFEYTGLTVEQSLNKGWTLLIHPDDLGGYMSEWEKALKTGDTYEFEFRLKRAIGLSRVSGSPYRRHLARAVALRGANDHIVEWFGTWTEIEAPKRSES